MKKIINTPKAPAPIGPYNQAVLLNNMLYTSGQIAINPETGVEKWRLQLDGYLLAKRGFTYHDGNIFVPSSNGIYVVNEQNTDSGFKAA